MKGPRATPVAAEIPPIRQREPYAVERHPAPRNWVRMVGYDRNGEYLTECIIPGQMFSQGTVDTFRDFLCAIDTRPLLTLTNGGRA